MEQQFHLSRFSQNAKLGGMPATMSDSSTCPPACPWRGNGCFAQYGPISWIWKKLDQGIIGGSWSDFLAGILALPKGMLWRYAQAGDLPGVGNRLDITKLRELVKANLGKHGFTYTHKPLSWKTEVKAVIEAIKSGFTINWSANTPEHADALHARAPEIPLVLTVATFDDLPKTTPGGIPLVKCVEQTHGIPCVRCELCYKSWRKSIVVFEAHGSGRKALIRFLQTLKEKFTRKRKRKEAHA